MAESVDSGLIPTICYLSTQICEAKCGIPVLGVENNPDASILRNRAYPIQVMVEFFEILHVLRCQRRALGDPTMKNSKVRRPGGARIRDARPQRRSGTRQME